MANATYDSMWQEAIGELNEQLHIEGAYEDAGVTGEAVSKAPEVTIFQAFQH